MQAYLEELGLLHCIEKSLEEEDFFLDAQGDSTDKKAEKEAKRKNRKKEDAKCKSVLIHKIADSQLEYVRGKTSPKAIWAVLQQTFEQKGVSGVFFLLKQLTGMRYSDSRPMEEHILSFEKLVRELESAGIKFDEPVVVFFLLQTMPKSYEQLITVLETLPVQQCSMEFVKSRLLSEDVKRQFSGSARGLDPGTAFVGKGGKFPFKCHGCGKPGHKRVDCPENKWSERANDDRKQMRKKNKSGAHSAEAESEDVAFIVSLAGDAMHSAGGEFRWVLDSGASEHMVNDKSCLVNVRSVDVPTVINVAKSGVSLVSRIVGDVKMSATVNGKQLRCTVYGVLFVPGLYTNLFSVKRVTERGMEVVFGKDSARITRNGQIVCTADRKGRLYELNVDVMKQSSAMVSESESQLSLWHRRYGHIGKSGLLKLIRSDMIEGIEGKVSSDSSQKICEPCMMGKQAKLPFEECVKSRSSRPLELVHTDVCGPFKPESWDDKKIFVTFIDDYTHFTAVYVLKAKSDVVDAFKRYAAMATTHFERKIARLRSDNGSEYMNEELMTYCSESGIVMEPSVPYTPQQNGVAERMNRTLLERTRAMLDESGVSRMLWSEAVQAAVHVVNRSPTNALTVMKTPYEMWYGRKPDVSRLRVFGSKVFCHVPKEKRSKLDGKSRLGYLTGYGCSGYRVWSPDQRKVIVCRDVVIEELPVKQTTHPEVYTNDHLVSDRLPEQKARSSNRAVDMENQYSDEEELEKEDSIEERESVEDDSASLKRSDRLRKPPGHLSDYEVYMAFALNAKNYVEELPDNVEELREREDWPEWEKAIKEELRSLEKNHTWDLVDLPAGKRVISSKWVFKIKHKADGSVDRYKARLVAKGCSQRRGFDYQETYASVVRISTVRTLLAVAVQKNLHVHQMDVRTAFLNGSLSETVFMRLPPRFERESRVCKLNKSLYGLKQAPRSWNERFNKFMLRLGFKRSQHDSCLYVRNKNGVVSYLILYVDDIILASNSLDELMKIKRSLTQEFEMDDMKELGHFLGLKVERNMEEGTLTINQSQYVDSLLKRFGMQDCRPVSTPLEVNLKLEKNESEPETKHPYRELIGCLTYLMLSSRPDISSAVNFLSRFQSRATDTHWTHLKRVLRYLQGTKDYNLVYKRGRNAAPLVRYADADWGSDVNDRKSTSGNVFHVFGNSILWTSRKQTTVALSSTEAEYVSLSQAACDAIWLRNVLREIGIDCCSPTTLYEDNQSCIHIASEPCDQKRLKHLDIRYHFIRECIQAGEIKVEYLPTQKQVADMFTKSLPVSSFKNHCATLGLRGSVVKQTAT